MQLPQFVLHVRHLPRGPERHTAVVESDLNKQSDMQSTAKGERL